jgi:class 3 adenylate cyclase
VRRGPGTRTATILLTDLVGSTALMADLGDTAFDRLREEHFARLRKAVTTRGGQELKNTGDGILATFASAVDALAAAEAAQQATEIHARSAGVPLSIRVGLSVGEVAVDDGDVFGTPVVEAARLAAAARPGQVLATTVVRVVAGSRAGVGFTDLGPLTLKGLPAPVSVCEVGWQRLPRPSIPLPTLLTDIGPIFVGRDPQLERLWALWEQAAAGEHRVAFIAGEPGVGKTRLAAELAVEVHEHGSTVLAGRCDEDLGVPYQPFVTALRHFLDETPTTELSSRLGRYGGELVRLVPELAEHLPGLPSPLRSDPETERHRLFDSVASWLYSMSARESVLLLLDDLQWAAKPTLLLLRHVVRSADAGRLLILCTYRDSELAAGHALLEVLGDIRRHSDVERFSLTGLDESGVAAFVEQTGRDLDADGLRLAHAIHEETGGNPLFVREMLRHLAEDQRDRGEATYLPAEGLRVPEGVRDVVGRRLSRLSKEANRVLWVAAVIGTAFELPVLQAAGGLDEEPLLFALEEATEAQLVGEMAGAASGYRFTHALVRDTLYERLSGARRRALHRRVAEAIEMVHAGRLDDHLPALAHHFARALTPTADPSTAVSYSRRAGDRALAQLAHDEAVTYYTQALEQLDAAEGRPADGQRLQLLISLGEAQRRAGDPAHRETLLHAAALAKDRGDGEALARAALANNRGAWYSVAGELDLERTAVLESALEAVGEADSAIRARLMANLATELVFSPERERRAALSDAALAMARRLDDPAALAEVLSARYYAILAPSNLSERLENTAELVAVVERLEDPVLSNRASWFRCRAATEAGDIREAEHRLAMVERFTTTLGQPWLRWTLGFAKTGLALLRGRVDEAEQLASETLALGQAAGDPEAPFIFALARFQILLEQGRPDEAEHLLADVGPEGTPQPLLESMQAVLQCERGRNDDARQALDRHGGGAFAEVPVNNTWLMTLTNWAAVCACVGSSGSAKSLSEILSPYANQLPLFAGTTNGVVAFYLGMLATTLRRNDEAETHFSSATAFHARIGAPIWLARTRLERGRMLLDRQGPADFERAQALLRQALATAHELGLAKVKRQATELAA